MKGVSLLMMLEILNVILPILYVLVTLLYAIHFFSEERRGGKFITMLLVLTLVVHLIYIITRITTYHHYPTASPAQVFTLIAFSIGIIYLWIEWVLSVKTTGMFVVGLVAAFQMLSSVLIARTDTINPLLRSPMFSLHTSAAILGYSGITISALYATLYLLLFYDIKGSKFGIVYNQLPPLEVLDSMHMKAASAGFSFLTVTILLGIVWLKLAFHHLMLLDWKIIAAMVTWVIFGVVIASKKFWGWSGKRVAYFSLTGFLTILVSMTVVNYFLTSFHRFH